MEKLAMCRICFATDLRMDSILDTHLQDTYEKLTLKEFETKDNRPITACYVCCARLQNCYQLSMACLQSEQLFEELMSGSVLDSMNIQDATRLLRLGTTPVIVESLGEYDLDPLSVEPSTQLAGVEVEVKMVVNKVLDNNASEENIKEEPCLNDCSSIGLQQDEVSLDIVKHELGNTSVSISKNLRPTMQRENAGDTSVRKVNPTQQAMAVADGYIDSNKFHSQSNLNSQIVKKNALEKLFACDICGHRFISKRNLNRHTKHHVDVKNYTCAVCGKSFSNRRAMVFHIRIHSERRYGCDVCKKRFHRSSHLVKHRQIHSGEKPFKCSACMKAFNDKSALLRHVRRHILVESGDSPYTCDFCQKGFTYKGSLAYHIRVHTGERPYTCKVCKKSFKDKSYLIKHNRVHTGEKPYSCDKCKKRYSQKISLKNHVCKPYRSSLLHEGLKYV